MDVCPGWTCDADEVLAVVASADADRWLWPVPMGERTESGVRFLVPGCGMVLDADPLGDGAWRVMVYRVRLMPYGSREVDAALFALAVAVWEVDAPDCDWSVRVPARVARSLSADDAGRRVAQALLDTLGEGPIDRWSPGWDTEWRDTEWRDAGVEQERWRGWARGLRGSAQRTVDVEGRVSGVWPREGHSAV
jgi:hypothetical protein